MLYLAMTVPDVFKAVDTPSIDDLENVTVQAVLPKFAVIFQDCPRWWEWTEAPAGMSGPEFEALKAWSTKLKADMRKNQKEGERTPWKVSIVSQQCALWARAAHTWDQEVCQ